MKFANSHILQFNSPQPLSRYSGDLWARRPELDSRERPNRLWDPMGTADSFPGDEGAEA
jgi:hypothetical protein